MIRIPGWLEDLLIGLVIVGLIVGSLAVFATGVWLFESGRYLWSAAVLAPYALGFCWLVGYGVRQ